jgi:hypothetical protein
MDATLAIAALVFFSLPVIPIYWLESYGFDLPSQAQVELYMVIFCLLWLAFTLGNYAEWQIHFDAANWWFNYWDYSYASDYFRNDIEKLFLSMYSARGGQVVF